MHDNKKEILERTRIKDIVDYPLPEFIPKEAFLNLEIGNDEKGIQTDYRAMYFMLFHTITCALEVLQDLEEETVKKACSILKNGQSRSEDMYIRKDNNI
ncbi:MAG: hypothetical protein HDT30_12825 [Clostridiales bacterium]|nr:hypothetical protein [Clostridiales bacterium]